MERSAFGEFTWVDLTASDLAKQTAFYEALFGWKHVDMPTTMSVDEGPVYREFTMNGARVAGISQMSDELARAGVPTVWNTYIATPDLDAAASRAVELGGTIRMPAMDVMDQGRMAGIQDPTGGAVYLWQARRHSGAEKFAEVGSVVWNEFETRAPEKAVEYFSRLFGWDIQFAQGVSPYWTISVKGRAQGGIMNMPPPVPAAVPSFWFVYFGVADVRASVDKARSLGATIAAEPMEFGGMSFAVIDDPVGAMFGVMTPMTPR